MQAAAHRIAGAIHRRQYLRHADGKASLLDIAPGRILPPSHESERALLLKISEFADAIERAGLRLLERRFRLRVGEIDLIVCYDAVRDSVRGLQRVGRTGRERDRHIEQRRRGARTASRRSACR